MIATKNLNGSLTLSEIVNGYLFTRTYYGYTKLEALRRFRAEVNQSTKGNK